jgi:GNAT superfamily N-acetyltransferase
VKITLRQITEENEPAVRALRTTPAQERFVSTVDYSLREAERHPKENPWLRAIYAGEQPVGFIMVAWDFVPEPPHSDGPFFLWKLLIDHEHQGKGYGKQAVEQVIDLIRADGGTELITSYVEGEGNPFGFYSKLGFVTRGDLDPEGELMLHLSL